MNNIRAYGVTKILAVITMIVVAASVLFDGTVAAQTKSKAADAPKAVEVKKAEEPKPVEVKKPDASKAVDVKMPEAPKAADVKKPDTPSVAAVPAIKDTSNTTPIEQKKSDSLTAVKDPADTTSADTSKAASTDSSASKNDSLNVIDTLVNKKDSVDKADTVSSIAADTLAKTASIDTVKATAAGDSGVSSGGQSLSDDEKENRLSFKDNKFVKWVSANIVYILFFTASILIIAGTVLFFMSRKDPRRFMTTTRLSVLDKMVQRGCRHIEANFADPALTVSAVCRELVTGEVYLNTLFVKEIGIDVQDFITQVRVDRIRKILEEDQNANIEATYRQCGFTDRATANRAFAALCGGVGMEDYAGRGSAKNLTKI